MKLECLHNFLKTSPLRLLQNVAVASFIMGFGEDFQIIVIDLRQEISGTEDEMDSTLGRMSSL